MNSTEVQRINLQMKTFCKMDSIVKQCALCPETSPKLPMLTCNGPCNCHYHRTCIEDRDVQIHDFICTHCILNTNVTIQEHENVEWSVIQIPRSMNVPRYDMLASTMSESAIRGLQAIYYLAHETQSFSIYAASYLRIFDDFSKHFENVKSTKVATIFRNDCISYCMKTMNPKTTSIPEMKKNTFLAFSLFRMDLNSPIMAGLELFVQENPSIAIEDYLGWNPVTEVSPPNVIGWKCTHCRISVDPTLSHCLICKASIEKVNDKEQKFANDLLFVHAAESLGIKIGCSTADILKHTQTIRSYVPVQSSAYQLYNQIYYIHALITVLSDYGRLWVSKEIALQEFALLECMPNFRLAVSASDTSTLACMVFCSRMFQRENKLYSLKAQIVRCQEKDGTYVHDKNDSNFCPLLRKSCTILSTRAMLEKMAPMGFGPVNSEWATVLKASVLPEANAVALTNNKSNLQLNCGLGLPLYESNAFRLVRTQTKLTVQRSEDSMLFLVKTRMTQINLSNNATRGLWEPEKRGTCRSMTFVSEMQPEIEPEAPKPVVVSTFQPVKRSREVKLTSTFRLPVKKTQVEPKQNIMITESDEESSSGGSDNSREIIGQFEVESIQGARVDNGEEVFFVKWKGYPVSENTWEPRCHLKDYEYLVQQFERKEKKRFFVQ